MNRKLSIIICLLMIPPISACVSTIAPRETSEPQITETLPVLDKEEQSNPTQSPAIETQPVIESPYLHIQTSLRSNPPCGGDNKARTDAILELDTYLKDDSLNWLPDMIDFYGNMISIVESEITEPITSGVRVWSMYNHGFIVKTPSSIIAFDLINGYKAWHFQMPDSILEQIDILFISHNHSDHSDYGITRKIISFGGKVVAPAENNKAKSNLFPLFANEELTLDGLQVKAYDGLHAEIPVRMYLVTTPEGYRIMHTGDNQTSENLPENLTVDILLLNAWVNESGSASAVIGIQNSIKKLNPKLTILGHIQELGHIYAPGDVLSRVPFEVPLTAVNESLPGYVSVQIWGEHCDFPLE